MVLEILFFILNFGYFIENLNKFIINCDGKNIKIERKKGDRFVFVCLLFIYLFIFTLVILRRVKQICDKLGPMKRVKGVTNLYSKLSSYLMLLEVGTV